MFIEKKNKVREFANEVGEKYTEEKLKEEKENSCKYRVNSIHKPSPFIDRDTRLFKRIMSVFKEDEKKNGILDCDRRELILDKLVEFLVQKDTHSLSYVEDCFDRSLVVVKLSLVSTGYVSFVPPSTFVSFQKENSKVQVPDYAGNTGEFKEAITGAFGEIRSLSDRQVDVQMDNHFEFVQNSFDIRKQLN